MAKLVYAHTYSLETSNEISIGLVFVESEKESSGAGTENKLRSDHLST